MSSINIFPTQPSSVNVNATTPPNPASFAKSIVTVVGAGTPVQGPNFVVATGKQLTVMANRLNIDDIYVANSSAGTANSELRILLKAGESVQLSVLSTNTVWVDAASNNMVADFITEIG